VAPEAGESSDLYLDSGFAARRGTCRDRDTRRENEDFVAADLRNFSL